MAEQTSTSKTPELMAEQTSTSKTPELTAEQASTSKISDYFGLFRGANYSYEGAYFLRGLLRGNDINDTGTMGDRK